MLARDGVHVAGGRLDVDARLRRDVGDLFECDARGGELLLVRADDLLRLALVLFSLSTAVSFHSNFADQNQMIHFLKNIMIAGGLLQIVAFGAGALSLDNRARPASELAHAG